MPPVHRINRAEIHLRAPDPELAEALIDRCSALHARAIAPLLDRVCSELSGPDRIDRIDRLELDLGALAVEDFEAELLTKLEAALRATLGRTLRAREAVGSRRSAIELLETYATLGNLPWWSDTAGDPVAAAITTLTADTEGTRALLDLLHMLAGDRAGVTRIARHADDAALAALIALRWPERAPAVAAAVRALERRLAGDTVALRAAVLGEVAGAGRDPAQVVPDMLLALAVARGWSTAQLRLELRACAGAPDLPQALRAALTSLGVADPAHGVSDVDTTEHASPDEPVAPSTDERARDTTTTATSAARSRPDAPAPARDRTDPASAKRSHDRDAPGDATRDGATSHSDPDATRRDAILERRTADDPDDATAPASDRSPTTRDAPPNLPTAPPAARARIPAITRPRPTPPRPDPATQAARDRALARIDGLHVEDAGLVLLWPFLDRLCLRCGLIDEQRRFVDEPAQHRAVALLEMIVTGEVAPPEFRLPLAKLLAGLSPDTSLMLAGPLDPALRDECDRLLAAVVGHVKVLGDMRPAVFRATFLRRAAALSVRDGAWVLQVERAAEDALLDRAPWSWSWVRLPWMPDTLRVEW